MTSTLTENYSEELEKNLSKVSMDDEFDQEEVMEDEENSAEISNISEVDDVEMTDSEENEQEDEEESNSSDEDEDESEDDEVLADPPYEFAIISPNAIQCVDSMAIMELEAGTAIFDTSRINAFSVTLIDANGQQTHHIPQIVPKTTDYDRYATNLGKVASTIRRSVPVRTKILVSDQSDENFYVGEKFSNHDHLYCALSNIATLIYTFHHPNNQTEINFLIREINIDIVQLKYDIQNNVIFLLQPREHPLSTKLKQFFSRSFGKGNESFETFMAMSTQAVDDLYNELNTEQNHHERYICLVTFFEFYALIRRVAGLFYENFTPNTQQVFEELIEMIGNMEDLKAPLDQIFNNIVTALNYIISFSEGVNFEFKPRLLSAAFKFTLNSYCQRFSGNRTPTTQQALDQLPRNHDLPLDIQATSNFDGKVFTISQLPFELNGQLLVLPAPFLIPNIIPARTHTRGQNLLRDHPTLQPFQAVIDEALFVFDAARASDYLIYFDDLQIDIKACLKILATLIF